MTTRSEKRTLGSVLRRALWYWDTFLAGLVGIGVTVFGLTSDEFDPSRVLFASGATIGFGLAVAAGVMHRWFADRTRSDYGQVIRALDHDESRAAIPYVAIAVVGIAATLWCAVGAAVIEGLDNTALRAILAGGAAGLAAWSLLGMLSLVLLTFQHHRYSARLAAMRERAERLERSSNSTK